MRYHWTLDRHVSHLNHGSFGATPRVVLDAQRRWRDEFETDPTGFITDRYFPELDKVRNIVAKFVGADPAGLALVTDATNAVASVVGSLPLAPGDEVVTTDHAYNACRNILDENASRTGATVVVAPIMFPDTSPDLVFDSVMARVTDATRLVVIDHVTSATGLVFPVARLLAELEPDIPVLVDGAHAPGMLPLSLDSLGASFYAGNLHKWVCAAKGSAFLWVAARHRDAIQPTVISHGWNTPREGANRLHRLFDWTGTFDPSAWLSVPSALETMASLDEEGWPGVMEANRELAVAARRVLCERLDIPPPAPESMIGSMAAVPLAKRDPNLADRLRAAGIVTLVSEWPDPGHQVLRVSAQRYNTLDEYEQLATAILAG